MNQLRSFPSARTWLRVALAAALGLSAWAAFGPSCGSCAGTSGFLLPDRGLAALGGFFYAGLLALSFIPGAARLLGSGVMAAGGIHAGLLLVLWQAGSFCGLCVGTALAAFVALGALLRLEPGSSLKASLMSPLAAALVQGWALLGGGLATAAPERAQAQAKVQDTFESVSPQPGTVRLIAYTRPDCGYCLDLERDVLPDLQRTFGSRMDVELRSALDLPGLPTPTLILVGAKGRQLFPGLPSTETLARTLRTLMGEPNDHATLSQKSR